MECNSELDLEDNSLVKKKMAKFSIWTENKNLGVAILKLTKTAINYQGLK